jgi:hypothetical protein
MTKVKDISFSINKYDKDGDITDEGIFLHFGETMVKVSSSFDDFKTIVNEFKKMIKEIEDN